MFVTFRIAFELKMDDPLNINASILTLDSELDDVTSEEARQELFFEIVFTIFCALGIIADALNVFIIFYFKRMRTITNIVLANWFIIDICALTVTPSAYEIVSVLEKLDLPVQLTCALFSIGALFHIFLVILVLIVSGQWALAAFWPEKYLKVRKLYKVVLTAIWSAILFLSVFESGLCYRDETYFHMYMHVVLELFFVLLCFSTIILHIVRVVRQLKSKSQYQSNLMLWLVTAFVLCWLLPIILVVMFDFENDLIEFAFLCIIYCNGILNFFILCWYHKGFQACLVQLIKCSPSNYADAAAEFENSEELIMGQDVIKVSFNNSVHSQQQVL